MSDSALQAQIEAAKAYEGLFVPALFGQWAPKVATAAHIRQGQKVLDVACGTGILAREVAAHVGSTGRVTGLDPVGGMLAVARQLAPDVQWQQGTAESLPFADQSFDAVVSQFGLMFASIRTMVEADLRGWLPVMGVLLVEDQIEAILNEAETVLRSYAANDGQMNFEVSAHIVAAHKAQ